VAEDPQLAGYYKEFVDKLISSYFYPYNVYIRNVSMRCVFIARVLVRLLVLRLPISLTFFKVRQSYCRVIARLDVCPSVRPSVRLSATRWYCVETAQPVVKLSSLPGSPMILVF